MNSTMHKLYKSAAFNSQMTSQLRKLCSSSTITNRVVDPNVSTQDDCNKNPSELCKDLYLKIQMSGPISIAQYMKQVLTHPTKGYYINKDVFGQEGDFTTSPEISQLFGEMIGVWIINECTKFHNKPLQLVELGPGRGTLSRDILRVFRQLGLSDQVSLHLVEVSPVLAEIQKKNLCTSPTSTEGEAESSGKHYQRGRTVDNVDIFWYKSIIDMPQGFSVFLAQEFFDALPIHKFQKTQDGWFEVLVDIDKTSGNQEKFRFVLSKTDACDKYVNKDERREHFEFSPESLTIMRYISAAMTENGGFSLFIDYGHSGEKTDTFRAFRRHKQWDPLVEPGTADLTADVDFAWLKRVARASNGLLCYGPVTQREFLIEMGINVRLMNLCKNATESQKRQLELGYNKIVGTEDMGSCFKVVSMFPQVLKDILSKYPVHGFSSCITVK